MTMHALAVPYADTRADQLVLTLREPLLPALAERSWQVGSVHVSLRLLGASHQVVVSGRTDFCETVACLPHRPANLPAELHDTGYRFHADVTAASSDRLRAVVDDLSRRADDAEVAGTPVLLGRFPRHPLAVTALFAQIGDAVVTWQTWHVYPQSGEIVETRSELDCAA